jgi:hypothetical protein
MRRKEEGWGGGGGGGKEVREFKGVWYRYCSCHYC